MLLIEGIEDVGVKIVGYGDGCEITLRDESGENAAALRGVADNSEKRCSRRRKREGLSVKAKAGYVIGTVRFGYASVRVDTHVEYRLNGAEANVVRRVYLLYAEDHGTRRITSRCGF